LSQFGDANFSSQDETVKLIKTQLAEGIHRVREDTAPSDWVVRAWQALPQKEAGWVATAVHQSLLHDSPTVRAGALRTLDMAPQMVDAAFLLDVATNHFDLFRGLQRPGDSASTDRGRDLVQLTASVATGTSGNAFRHRLATDPTYGIHVLAALARLEPDWTAEHAADLANAQIDPDGTRLTILIFNLRHDAAHLQQFVRQLHAQELGLNGRLHHTIQAKIRDSRLQAALLAILT
jgi:hypothetical protein